FRSCSKRWIHLQMEVTQHFGITFHIGPLSKYTLVSELERCYFQHSHAFIMVLRISRYIECRVPYIGTAVKYAPSMTYLCLLYDNRVRAFRISEFTCGNINI